MGRSGPPHPVDLGHGGLISPRSLPLRSYSEVTVTVNLKKVVTWLIVAFVVFYVIRSPDRSAHFVRNAGHALGDAASSLATFVGSLF